jgi:hypothetical protein
MMAARDMHNADPGNFGTSAFWMRRAQSRTLSCCTGIDCHWCQSLGPRVQASSRTLRAMTLCRAIFITYSPLPRLGQSASSREKNQPVRERLKHSRDTPRA